MSEEFYELAQPEEISIREREDGMGAYLMMFASIGAGLPLPIINLIASVIYYFVNKAKSRFVHFHSLQSLLSQIPVSILNAISVFWTVQIIFSDLTLNTEFYSFISMTVLANLTYFVFSIIAAIKARAGKYYYFILFGKIAYSITHKIRPGFEPGTITNKPPVA